MIRGIAIMGLNGCGKSTITHAIAKKLGFYEMDAEDYYFPEQKNSRQAILEQQYDVKCEYKGALPYSMPRSTKEVQEMIGNRSNERVEASAAGIPCKKVRLDGTKSIEEIISSIMRVVMELI